MENHEIQENVQKGPTKAPSTTAPLRPRSHNVAEKTPPNITDQVTPTATTLKHRPTLSVEIPQFGWPLQYQTPLYRPPPPTPLWVSNFQPAPPNMTPWIPVTLDCTSPVHFSLPPPGVLPLKGSNTFVPPNPLVSPSYFSAPLIPTRSTMMPGNYTTDEYGFGREAKALEPAWAKLVLKGFTRKYPLTGTQCQTAVSVCSSGSSTPTFLTPETSAPSSPGPGTVQQYPGSPVLPHPAVIQQKLEELLLKKKEKKLILALQRAGF